MTGTTVEFSDEYIKGLAQRIGRKEEEVRGIIALFNKDVEGIDYATCSAEEYPRFDDYIRSIYPEVESKEKTYDPIVKHLEEQLAAAKLKAHKREMHRRLREKLGMPASDK